jgi:hypothetical protein
LSKRQERTKGIDMEKINGKREEKIHALVLNIGTFT